MVARLRIWGAAFEFSSGAPTLSHYLPSKNYWPFTGFARKPKLTGLVGRSCGALKSRYAHGECFGRRSNQQTTNLGVRSSKSLRARQHLATTYRAKIIGLLRDLQGTQPPTPIFRQVNFSSPEFLILNLKRDLSTGSGVGYFWRPRSLTTLRDGGRGRASCTPPAIRARKTTRICTLPNPCRTEANPASTAKPPCEPQV